VLIIWLWLVVGVALILPVVARVAIVHPLLVNLLVEVHLLSLLLPL